jgi:hypothetical protein
MRTVIQIATMPQHCAPYTQDVRATLFALCDDGTMWAMHADSGRWTPVTNVPQGEA